MANIIAWFFSVTSIRLITVLSLVYLIFPIYLLPNIIDTGATGPLDLLFWYDNETLYRMLASYGEAVRADYIIGLLTVDVAYPIFYGTLLALIIALVIKKLSIPFSRYVIFIPYVAVLFDLSENTLLVYLLYDYPTYHILLANLAGFVTAAKWSAFGVIAMTVAYMVFIGIRIKRTQAQHI